MDNRPILMPDTSMVNAVADDSHSEPLLAGLMSGYFLRFPFTTVSEILANSSGMRRKRLFSVCRRLLSSGGDCIEPPHEIIKTMVARFEKSLPVGLAHVNLRMEEAEDEILRAENFDDELATQEREEGWTNDKVFDGVYANAKIAFDELAARGTRMPSSVAEYASQLQQSGGFWTLARTLYERVAMRPADDASIERFYEECAPFRALRIAVLAATYDRCIRPSGTPSLKSGRNDTFMATYLPYCNLFITNDPRQLACYREVISLAGLAATVRSYDEFRNRLFLSSAAGAAR